MQNHGLGKDSDKICENTSSKKTQIPKLAKTFDMLLKKLLSGVRSPCLAQARLNMAKNIRTLRDSTEHRDMKMHICICSSPTVFFQVNKCL